MKWQLKDTVCQQSIQSLSKELGIDPILATLLVLRGITTFNQAKQFFRPKLQELHDPFLMKGMATAVQRLKEAKEQNKKLMILGDYDVDGTTSTSMLHLYFKEIGIDNIYYIPDRYGEGYGISFKAIDYAVDSGVSMIVSIDCGTTSIAEIDYAREKGIDFIVCDHHNPGEQLPKAVAILNPKQEDCPYPYKELSACGVGFKLIQALSIELNHPLVLMDYLDLVAISIAADIVPVTGENRVMLSLGMQQLKKDNRVGLKPFLRSLDLNGLTCSDIVFKIAPKINAAGRIKQGIEAVELMVEEDLVKADQRHQFIDEYNESRKSIEKDIVDQALDMLDGEDLDRKTNVLYGDDWHKGVIGIVASKVIEHHYKPTIIFTKVGDYMYASARSVRGFDIYEALSSCNHLIEKFGGHKYAAGLTIQANQFDAFKESFESVVAQTITEEQLDPVISVDAEINLDQLTPKFLRILDQMLPFGPGNMSPVFLCKGLKSVFPPSLIGKDQSHLKARVCQDNKGSFFFDAIGFGLSDKKDTVEKGIFNAVFSVDKNYWQGIETVQLRFKDIM